VKKVVSTNSTNQVPTPIEAADKIQLQKENEQKVMFWIIFGIVILIVVAILIATVVYMLKGTSYSPAMSGGVGVGGVGGV
jgi:lipopolysaccharide/colanic/teichoic acid biosynthesis glycosyltransferase